MTKINNPKIKNMNFPEKILGELPLKADDITARKFIEDNDLGTLVSFESSNPKFSNNHGTTYNYYVSGQTYTE